MVGIAVPLPYIFYFIFQCTCEKISISTGCSRISGNIVPPESGNKNIESDEEDIQDDVLDIEGLPTEIPGEVEIHLNNSDISESENGEKEIRPTIKKSKIHSSIWKKNENVAFHAPPDNIDKVGENNLGKSEFEIFSLFLTPCMIEDIVNQTILYSI